jgi:hypothetical protein
MLPVYIYMVGGVLTATGELYCGYLNGECNISIKNVLEVGVMWPAVVAWIGSNLLAEKVFN